ncbi:MAG: hypothetical protein AAF763_14725 [Pseudomonadota bacterium]
MRTCYLHLGMPKTGSTSIQTAFSGYEDRDLVYAKLRVSNHGSALTAKFADAPENSRVFRRHAVRGKNVGKSVKSKIAHFDQSMNTSKSVIYSCEWIVDTLSPDEVAKMLAFFKARFDRLVVIAYVRPLASLVNSQFQQQVKMGRRKFVLPRPRYRKFFGPLVEGVDRENLQLVRFDRADLVGGDVVSDFAHRVGAQQTPKVEEEVNESLSAEAVGAMYAFNKYTGPLLRPRKRMKSLSMLRETLRGVGEIKFGLDAELIEAHMQTYAEDVAWIEAQAGFEVKGSIKSVPTPVRSEAQLLGMADQLSGRLAKKLRAMNLSPSDDPED